MKQFPLIFLLLLSSTSAVFSQSTVRGTVTDSRDGTPLQGITIKAKGEKGSTFTATNGSFELKVTKAKSIDISSVGYISQTVSIGDGNVIIKLDLDNKGLSEVVVTGYSTKSRRANAGSVSTVSIDDIRTQPIASFDQLLQGQAPGINVKTGSGQPGRSADIVIRGKGSVNGSNSPLFIVDGVEVRGGDFSTMNQGDFESVTILKDAASTAIYGSRAGGGVIVVTTKKGKAGITKFSYDMQMGQSRLPENKLKLMNTQEKLDFEMNIAGNPNGWSAAEVAERRTINQNWNDAIFKKGNMQSHQLSASGGNDKTTFYTSLGYFNEEGVVIETGIKRYTGRLNITHTENRVKIGVNLSGGWSTYRGTDEGSQSIGAPLNNVLWALPYEKAYNADGSYGTSVQFPFWINPAEELKENGNKNWQLKSTGNVYLEYKLPWINNLKYKINVGGDYSQFETFGISNAGTQGSEQSGDVTAEYLRQGRLSRSLDRRFRYTITNSLTHTAFLDKSQNHSLTSSLYTEFVKNQGRNFAYTGYGLLLPFRNEAGLVSGTADNGYIPVVGGGFPENSTLLSYFGNLDYAFKKKYFLSITGRSDGSSRLSPKNKWTQYGSVGAAWIISDENFYNLTAVNFLKLKASYGSVGNQTGIGEFPYLQQYGRGTFAGQGTLQVNRLGNPDLTWEKRRTTNIGLEFELFKSRVRGSVEVYNSLTKGLFFSPRLPATAGGNDNFLSNAGNMENKGIELSLNVKVINTPSFKWSVDANYAYNKNTIKSLPDNQTLQLYKSYQALQVGKPFNSFYLVKFAGVNPQLGNSQYYKADGKTITDVYDANDLVVLGTSDAPHNGGLTNTFSYKGIELSTFFVFSTGNYVYNNARYNVEFYQYTVSGFSRNALNAWTKPGQITDFPDINEATQSSTTRFLEKGDFWRLRNIMLSYSLPRNILGKLKIQNMRLFVQGQNLYTNFKFQGWDPEVSSVSDIDVNSSASVTGAQYPALKSVNIGLNLTF